MGCAPVAQSEPSDQCSFFQIGTLSLTRSMHASAAANASARCGLDTTTATAVSESSSRPSRCTTATRSTPGHSSRIAATISASRPRRLLVRLVGERDDIVAAFGMVADDAEERDDGSADGRRRPRDERIERDRVVVEREPVARVGDRLGHGHGCHCRNASAAGPFRPSGPPSNRKTRQYTPAVNEGLRSISARECLRATTAADDGDDDDEPTLGGPPHPMDRVWRHPSELLRSSTAGRREGGLRRSASARSCSCRSARAVGALSPSRCSRPRRFDQTQTAGSGTEPRRHTARDQRSRPSPVASARPSSP